MHNITIYFCNKKNLIKKSLEKKWIKTNIKNYYYWFIIIRSKVKVYNENISIYLNHHWYKRKLIYKTHKIV